MYKLSSALTLLGSSIMADSIEESSCMLYDAYSTWDLRSMKVTPSSIQPYYTSSTKAVLGTDGV